MQNFKSTVYFICIFFSSFSITFANEKTFTLEYDKTIPSLEGKVKNWNILSQYSKNLNKMVCYMYSTPFQKTGNHKDTREPYLMITYISKNNQEVSLSTGYRIKKGSKPSARIDESNYSMTTDGKLIWNIDKSDDFNMIESMIDSKFFFIHSDSSIGTYALDTYDLSYFYMAYVAMVDICKKF